ncbi:MAG: hypothetical protein CBE24_07295 [bacterium TMED264]|nr:MAG: hypothetical protein CBE24_07295 [bacterium TMED264]
MKCVILAGGIGSRFWPYSRKNQPKQLLNIFGEKSMLQITVDRLKKINKISEIYIITRKDLYKSIIKNIKGINARNVIIEPSGKNTAPAIGMMAAYLALKNPDDVMCVFPADHYIVGHQKFQKAIYRAVRVAKKGDNIVTIGIKPNYPSTAYGYIQYEENNQIESKEAFQVKAFAEKPHGKLAERFISSGDFLWNAGMFFWKVNTFLNSMKIHMPELLSEVENIAPKIENGDSFDSLWEFIKPESIDYGLLEKADNIYVVPADFQWNDIGSWKALYHVFNSDRKGNIIRGNGTIMEGKGNLIHSKDKFTAVLGIDNAVVINTGDVTLVVNKDKVENIKKLVHYLNTNNLGELT